MMYVSTEHSVAEFRVIPRYKDELMPHLIDNEKRIIYRMRFGVFSCRLGRCYVPQPSKHLDEDLFRFVRRDNEPFCEAMDHEIVAIAKHNVKRSYGRALCVLNLTPRSHCQCAPCSRATRVHRTRNLLTAN